ncbi:MAG: winged helix-turn-helix domain-containing protein [Nitrospira sp.]
MKKGEVGTADARAWPVETTAPSTVTRKLNCFNDVTIVPLSVDPECGRYLQEVLLPSVLDQLRPVIDRPPHVSVESSIVLLPVLLAVSGLNSAHDTLPTPILQTNTCVTESPYVYGPLVLDPFRHEVRLNNQDIALTPKEFGVLEYLLSHPGRVRTREMVLNAVWGVDYYGTTRTVDVHIRRIKQKIPFLESAIICIPSLGYKLCESDRSFS